MRLKGVLRFPEDENSTCIVFPLEQNPVLKHIQWGDENDERPFKPLGQQKLDIVVEGNPQHKETIDKMNGAFRNLTGITLAMDPALGIFMVRDNANAKSSQDAASKTLSGMYKQPIR
ncbi:MAG TPA: hypothetical protein VJB82_03060 [Candidatus Peribacterales bacterium]|nr:hypothetical protein [Candidatus Peribacterales bacterium]